jgi:hypothetical protein
VKNINELTPKEAIIFENEDEEIMTLILNETVVSVITDKSDFERNYCGLITYMSEDGLEIECGELMFWRNIKEIKIVE